MMKSHLAVRTDLRESTPPRVVVAYGSLPILLVAGIAVMGAIKLALSLGRPFTNGGDIGFLEIQIRQALHGGVAVGPYSRYGWHHPGPFLFYLYAPLYWLSGEDSRSLFLSTWLLNCGSLIAAVAIVRRRAGELAGATAAAATLLYICAAGFKGLIYPWNPFLLACPLLLLLVAAAAAATGSAWSLVIAAVTGSFLVQTHIATAPVTAVVGAVAVVGYLSCRRRPDPAGPTPGFRRSRRAISTGAVVLALIWVGPVLQEITHSNGNMTKIARFYLHPPISAGSKSHSLASSLAAVSDSATVVPAGNPTDFLLHRRRLLLAAGYVVAGLVSFVVWRRKSRFLACLALLTPVGLAVAALASTRIIGPYYGYLFSWCETLSLPVLISGGAGVLTWITGQVRVQRRSAVSLILATVLALTLSGLTARVLARGDVTAYPDFPGPRIVAARIEQVVGSRTRFFTVHVVRGGIADQGVIPQLAKDGYRFAVDPKVALYGGTAPGGSAIGGGGLTFLLQGAGPPLPGTLPATHLLTSGNVGVWVR